jgi:hypothetical protein
VPDTKPGAGQSHFPAVDRATLNDVQARIADVLREQYEIQPGGEAYAEGSTEPWCADFVSWVMHEAGAGLENPHSRSWCIPGVYTLQEFYQSRGRFADALLSPMPGDVVLYGEDSPLVLHTNVVIAADNATMTTVGGNEEGTIRVRQVEFAAATGVLGLGRLV